MNSLKLENLHVYQKAEDLADAVWEVVSNWDHFAKETVGKQLIRAADSVGANIAEGFGRASAADNQRFIRIARGSLYESRHFLRRADNRNLIHPEQKQRLQSLLSELPPMLNAYLTSLKKQVHTNSQIPTSKS